MAELGAEVADWLLCCGCEDVAPQFVKSGIDSIKKLRDLEEHQFRIIGSSSVPEWRHRMLQRSTSTVEELSQEVSVSVFVKCVKDILRSRVGRGWCARVLL